MSKRKPHNVEVISVDTYPRVLPRQEAAQFLNALKGKAVKDRVGHVINAGRHALSDAVRLASERLEKLARKGDMEAILAESYEIRSMAETAGLTASGRIADGLCFYLNAVTRAETPADPEVVSLHVDAIARAARAQDEATRLGTEVANELRALVLDRLGLSAAPKPSATANIR